MSTYTLGYHSIWYVAPILLSIFLRVLDGPLVYSPGLLSAQARFRFCVRWFRGWVQDIRYVRLGIRPCPRPEWRGPDSGQLTLGEMDAGTFTG